MEQFKERKMIKRILAMLLAISLLISANGMTILAQTVSGNQLESEAIIEDSTISQNNQAGDSVISQDSQAGDGVISQNSQAEAGTIAAPVHYCTNDGAATDTTTWSYIYFGSYPQTEITDADLISKIDSAIEVYGTAGDIGMDVWVDGIKYRRVSKEESKYISNYEKADYRYFKWERIKWRVLEKSDNTLFLMADSCLDCKKYNESFEDTSWADCTVRTWLNDTFYNTAFSSEEQSIILETTNQNTANPEYSTEGCADTKDKVFFLSVKEATNPTYGFCDLPGTYSGYNKSASRTTFVTDYSFRRGVSDFEYTNYEKATSWYWLRSVGQTKSYAMTVQWETEMSYFGNGVAIRYIGACPAVKINCDLGTASDVWTTTDDNTSGAGGEDAKDLQAAKALFGQKEKTDYRIGETLNLDDLTVEAVYAAGNVTLSSTEYQVDTSEVDMNTSGIYPIKITFKDKSTLVKVSVSKAGMPANPVHYCIKDGSDTEYTKWYYVSLGSYPQTKITDEALIEKIEQAIIENGSAEGEESGVEKNIDVTVDGEKYRRVTNKESAYEYFKWEKIKWRILENDGAEMLLVSDKALDCQPYHSTETDITWENATLRTWLNKDFYETAFSETEKNAMILQENINNGTNTYHSTINGGNATEDYVWLLSVQEIFNSAYGFCNYNTGAGYITKRFSPTDYAETAGVDFIVYKDEPKGCAYFLRSHGSSLQNAAIMIQKGIVMPDGVSVNNDQGICPVIKIKISCDDAWSYEKSEDETDKDETDKDQTDINGEDTENKDEKITNTDEENEEANANQPIEVTKLKITGPSKKLAAGKKVKLTLTVTPSNATNKSVTWTSSNKKYATVSKTGKVTIKKAGIGKTVTITAKAKDGSGVTAKFKFKIMKHSVKSIKIKAPSKKLKAGKTMKLKVTIKTTGKKVNKTLKWKSSNTKYATVSKNGKVKAKKAGKGKTVTITAMSTDGSNKKAKVKIKIK